MLHGIEEQIKEANDLSHQALQLKRAMLDLAIQMRSLRPSFRDPPSLSQSTWYLKISLLLVYTI